MASSADLPRRLMLSDKLRLTGRLALEATAWRRVYRRLRAGLNDANARTLDAIAITGDILDLRRVR